MESFRMKKIIVWILCIVIGSLFLYVAYSKLLVPYVFPSLDGEKITTYEECVAAGYETTGDENDQSRCLVGDGRVFTKENTVESIVFEESMVYTCKDGMTLSVESSNNDFKKVIFSDGRSFVLGKSQLMPGSNQYSNGDDSIVLKVPDTKKNIEIYENGTLFLERCN